MLGLMGEKIGMTQIYAEDGGFIPVTVVRLLPNVVTAVKTKEKHGYTALQIGYGEQKESRVSKPVLGALKKAGVGPVKLLKEFRTSEKLGDVALGTKIPASVLAIGEKIDVQATSKGRGFQGVMKRYHFAGGRDSHGNSLSHRVPGSIGQRAYPGRVFPGKKMPGQMGNVTVTTKNLVVVGIEAEQNLILIKGCVPGGNRTVISIIPHAADFETRALGGKKQAASTEAPAQA